MRVHTVQKSDGRLIGYTTSNAFTHVHAVAPEAGDQPGQDAGGLARTTKAEAGDQLVKSLGTQNRVWLYRSVDNRLTIIISVQIVREDDVGKSVAMAHVALNALCELQLLNFKTLGIVFDSHPTNVVRGVVKKKMHKNDNKLACLRVPDTGSNFVSY